jgi:hypothetical protein
MCYCSRIVHCLCSTATGHRANCSWTDIELICVFSLPLFCVKWKFVGRSKGLMSQRSVLLFISKLADVKLQHVKVMTPASWISKSLALVQCDRASSENWRLNRWLGPWIKTAGAWVQPPTFLWYWQCLHSRPLHFHWQLLSTGIPSIYSKRDGALYWLHTSQPGAGSNSLIRRLRD